MVQNDLPDELDLRGRTAQEAREAVRDLVDAAALAGRHEVRVIHGRGTGAVRKAVRDELAKHPLVDEQVSDSADGATVVRLPDAELAELALRRQSTGRTGPADALRSSGASSRSLLRRPFRASARPPPPRRWRRLLGDLGPPRRQHDEGQAGIRRVRLALTRPIRSSGASWRAIPEVVTASRRASSTRRSVCSRGGLQLEEDREVVEPEAVVAPSG